MAELPKTEKIPAVVFAPAEAANKIAALTVLDRLIVALHRGGAGPITILKKGQVPVLKRAKALNIPLNIETHIPPTTGNMLVAQGNVMVHASDVRRCVEMTGRLQRGDQLLPIGVVPAHALAGAFDGAVRSGEGGDPAAWISDVPEKIFAGAARVKALGVAALIRNDTDAGETERALWATMWSSSDGFIDKIFNRPVGRFLSKVLIFTPVSPNMISIASILIGVIAAVFLAEGSFQPAIIGAILFQLSAIVDCVDGDIARMLFKESPLGKWIDLVGDQIVHLSVFAGITFGVLRNGGDEVTLLLGLSAVVGGLLSFVVVLRGMKQPPSPSGQLQRLIDAATSRDFSVIVLALAFFQKLPWFLWLAGVGSHAFWVTALGLQLASKPRNPSESAR
jgi:phosphatidylglycerophosphate synthase